MLRVVNFFIEPPLYHLESKTPLSVDRKWLAARIATVALATYVVTSRSLTQRFSQILPVVAALVTYLWSKAQAKEAIDIRLITYILPSKSQLSEVEKKQIQQIDVTNSVIRTLLFQQACELNSVENQALFAQLVAKAFHSMTLPEKKQAFAGILSQNKIHILRILLENLVATPSELEIGEVNLLQALILKHYKFNVQPPKQINIHDFATIGVVLSSLCVHNLLLRDYASFEAAYARLQNAESFWGRPNDGLFDLSNPEVLNSLWVSVLKSSYFPPDTNNLFGEVVTKHYELLPLTSRAGLFKDMRVTRRMVQYLLKHKIIPLDHCDRVIQHICWTDTRIIDETTATVLTEAGFDPNAKNPHTTCLQTVIMDYNYFNYGTTPISWLEHIEILLAAGAKYNEDLVDYCTALQKRAYPQSEFLGLLNKYPQNKT